LGSFGKTRYESRSNEGGHNVGGRKSVRSCLGEEKGQKTSIGGRGIAKVRNRSAGRGRGKEFRTLVGRVRVIWKLILIFQERRGEEQGSSTWERPAKGIRQKGRRVINVGTAPDIKKKQGGRGGMRGLVLPKKGRERVGFEQWKQIYGLRKSRCDSGAVSQRGKRMNPVGGGVRYWVDECHGRGGIVL